MKRNSGTTRVRRRRKNKSKFVVLVKATEVMGGQ
jgi:hypothetical protein